MLALPLPLPYCHPYRCRCFCHCLCPSHSLPLTPTLTLSLPLSLPDMVLTVARDFMRSMAQPIDRAEVGRSLLSQASLVVPGTEGCDREQTRNSQA